MHTLRGREGGWAGGQGREGGGGRGEGGGRESDDNQLILDYNIP